MHYILIEVLVQNLLNGILKICAFYYMKLHLNNEYANQSKKQKQTQTKKTPRDTKSLLPAPPSCEDPKRRYCLQTNKRAQPTTQPCWHPDCGLPEL